MSQSTLLASEASEALDSWNQERTPEQISNLLARLAQTAFNDGNEIELEA